MTHEYMPFIFSFLGTVVALLLGVLFNNREVRSLNADTMARFDKLEATVAANQSATASRFDRVDNDLRDFTA
jgi:hypothetical protein